MPSGSFQKPTGIEGNGAVQTNSPRSSRTGLPASSKISTLIPSPRHWISPRYTGRIGHPNAKQDTMSVPPEIDVSSTSDLIDLYTYSKPSGSNGEPVDSTDRRALRSTVSIGTKELFSSADRYLALV